MGHPESTEGTARTVLEQSKGREWESGRDGTHTRLGGEI